MKEVFAGIEAGGTKFVCAIGDSSGNLIEKVRIPTRLPHETMQEVVEFIKQASRDFSLLAIGVATFGPIYLDQASPYFGYVDSEHKTGWGHFDLIGSIKSTFKDVPIGFDTDVNGAALGEWRFGRGHGLSNIAYLTVGTGIGAGFIVDNKILHGLVHPEMGHIYVPRDKTKDPFNGMCHYHGDCLEGLASGPAMKERWNVNSAMDLPEDHVAWDLEAEYLAYAMINCIYSVSPERIIVGGGVMKQKSLYAKVRVNTQRLLNKFIKHSMLLEDMDNYIVPPGLLGESGVIGALVLAEKALRRDHDIAVK